MRVISLTHTRLIEALDYDPATGAFVWKIRPSNRIKPGMRAGVVGTNGYRFIMVDGEKLQASRLAWFYAKGEWPKGDIRFEDRNTDNCAIENLRDVSKIEIARERKTLSNNTTGYRGVAVHKSGYQSTITANYQQVNLGVFDTAEKASAVYEQASSILSDAKTPEECSAALSKIVQLRRKRVAWERLLRSGRRHVWNDFDAFSSEIGEMKDDEATIAAIDESYPIAAGNFKFLTKVQGEFDRSTKEGRAAYAKAYRVANPDRYRHAHLRANYDIDDIEFERRKAAQGGKCLICEEVPDERLAVDHNHETKAVRALLCKQCNFALGQFGDNLDLLKSAVTYLENFEGENALKEPASLDRDWLFVATSLSFGA